MNNSFCSLYAGSGTVWPVAAFPANLFPNYTNVRRLQAQNAWNFFEFVESGDAAIRVALSNRGGYQAPALSAFPQSPVVWTPIPSSGALTLYKQGQSLHSQVCPNVNWRPQRSLGIPKVPLTNVYPASCSP